MRILISGGTGFIGQELCTLLVKQGHELVIWSRQKAPTLPSGVSATINRLSELEPDSIEAVINLAGAAIADKRWSVARKQELIDSRVETTEQLIDWMRAQRVKPQVLVSASAVGYYGEQGEQEVTEHSAPVAGFTHELCAAWEQAALSAQELGVRVCLVRTGVVLGAGGGSIAKMLPAFRLGLGGRLGDGRHWFPWIHIQDMARIYAWLLSQEQASGVYNASAPQPVTNAEFTQALGRALKRPTFFPMPALMLKLLLGELADLLLVSTKMRPKRLLDEGFEFNYTQLAVALDEVLRVRRAQS